MIKQQRQKGGSVLIVDSGDVFVEKEEMSESLLPSARLKAQVIAQIYERIGCDAINVAERDLSLGIEFLKGIEKKMNIPFISANLTDTKNRPLFKRYVIRKVNGKSVGIFGILGDTTEITSKVKKLTSGSVLVQDAVKSAESVVKELTGKVDLIVALTHEGVGRDWVIARRVPGIEVIVGGHDKQKIAEPFIAEKTRIVQAGEKGQHLGLFQVSFGRDGAKTIKNSLIPLGREVPDDEGIKSTIKNYQKEVAALYGSSEKPSSPFRSLTSCSGCHPRQYKAWEATRHARAHASLVKRGRQFDPECLPCHTTRFEEPGGFFIKLQQSELLNVQCESCHHISGEHPSRSPSASGKMGEEICAKCHTSTQSPAFEKERGRYLEGIKH